MTEPDHNQRGNKYDHAAQGNLEKRQVLCFRAQTEKWSDKIIKRIHI
jgi:hypothetical protein